MSALTSATSAITAQPISVSVALDAIHSTSSSERIKALQKVVKESPTSQFQKAAEQINASIKDTILALDGVLAVYPKDPKEGQISREAKTTAVTNGLQASAEQLNLLNYIIKNLPLFDGHTVQEARAQKKQQKKEPKELITDTYRRTIEERNKVEAHQGTLKTYEAWAKVDDRRLFPTINWIDGTLLSAVMNDTNKLLTSTTFPSREMLKAELPALFVSYMQASILAIIHYQSFSGKIAELERDIAQTLERKARIQAVDSNKPAELPSITDLVAKQGGMNVSSLELTHQLKDLVLKDKQARVEKLKTTLENLEKSIDTLQFRFQQLRHQTFCSESSRGAFMTYAKYLIRWQAGKWQTMYTCPNPFKDYKQLLADNKPLLETHQKSMIDYNKKVEEAQKANKTTEEIGKIEKPVLELKTSASFNLFLDVFYAARDEILAEKVLTPAVLEVQKVDKLEQHPLSWLFGALNADFLKLLPERLPFTPKKDETLKPSSSASKAEATTTV